MTFADILAGILTKYSLTWPLTLRQVEKLGRELPFTAQEFSILLVCVAPKAYQEPEEEPAPSAAYDVESRVALLSKRQRARLQLYHRDDIIHLPPERAVGAPAPPRHRNGADKKDADAKPETN